MSRTTAKGDRQVRILEAALSLLSRRGISGVSMRAVAAEAKVALGLVNYYYEDKTSLIAAALHRVEEQDRITRKIVLFGTFRHGFEGQRSAGIGFLGRNRQAQGDREKNGFLTIHG